MVKEGAGSRDDTNFLTQAGHLQSIQGFYRRAGLTFRCAKAGKVMMADQPSRGFGHGACVERHGDMPHQSGIESRRSAPIEDPIEISSTCRREACVEIVSDGFDIDHRYRPGTDMKIDRAANLVQPIVPGQVHMRDLPSRVNPSIGPSSALDKDIDTGKRGECFF